MKVAALAGGTGSAKLLRGLHRLPVDLKVVANVGDNIWIYGVYVCPDIDIASYTLAGVADLEKGWGITGDTFGAMAQLSRFGAETWFKLGDRDLGTCLARTEMMRAGATLTKATEKLRRALGVRCPVLPLSDDPVETRVITSKGDLHLQEFWVRDRGLPKVKEVKYRGARSARITKQVETAILGADRVVLCPANPITSIGPMLAVPGFVRLLSESNARVVALSPMIGSAPFSGPAGNLMRAEGRRHDSAGVAELYAKFLDCILISVDDSHLKGKIESLGVKCAASDTRIMSEGDELRLSKEMLEV